MADPKIFDEVVCRSFKVVDRLDRVRAFVGELPTSTHSEGPVFVVELRDEKGRARVSLMLTPDGPVLLFDHKGNNVIELGVQDWAEDTSHSGAYFVGSDMTGEPVAGWRIERDGTLDLIHSANPTT